jgi:hypothetical protein
MADRLEKGYFTLSYAHSPALKVIWGPYQEHIDNIHNKLKEFLPLPEALTVATQVQEAALEIDEEIGRILKDPKVRKLYDYDGQFFTARFERLFHTAFDGDHILKWLRETTVASFFRGKEKQGAIEYMLEEVRKHAAVAKIRRMNWEDTQTLGMLPKDVLDALLKESHERMKACEVVAMSSEEQVFFQSFEEQLKNEGSN